MVIGELHWEGPWRLAAAAAAVPAIWLTLRLDLLKRQRWVLATLRVVAVLALAIAWAGPTVSEPDAGPVIVFGYDLSTSWRTVSGDPQAVLREALAEVEAPPDVRSALVVFADGARTVRPLGPGLPDAAAVDPARIGLPTDRTNLEAGLAAMLSQARSALGAGAGADVRLVLFTDGRQNRGDVFAVAPTGPGIAVHARVRTLPTTNARVTALRLPDRIGPNETIAGSVELMCDRSVEVGLTVRRLNDGATIAVVPARVPLPAGVPFRVDFVDKPPTEGVWSYEARIVDAKDAGAAWRDASAVDDRLTASVTVTRDRTVLLVTAQPDGIVATALKALGDRHVVAVSPARMPASALELARFESVVLDNVRLASETGGAEPISDTQIAALDEYVRGFGGGLVVLGGSNAFGPGRYHLKPKFDELLPVNSDPRSRNPVALVLVLDGSGSMAGPAGDGRTKWQVVRDAVQRLAPPVLNPQDELGVIVFFRDAERSLRVVRELGGGVDWPALAGALSAHGPTGGTPINPALDKATELLGKSKAPVKRILVLSDGAADDAMAPGRAARLIAGGIRLSAVITGDPAELDGPRVRELRQLARDSGGRDHVPSEFLKVPDIFLDDLYQSGDFVKTGPVALVKNASSVTGMAALPVPPLERLARTLLRPGAEAAVTAASGEPAVAVRRVGAGRSAAFASAFEEGWGGSWKPGAGAVLRALLDWTMRPAGDPDCTATAEVRGTRATVELTAVRRSDGVATNDLAPRVRLRGPVEVPEQVMKQVGPGRYRAEFELGVQGTWRAEIEAGTDGDTRRASVSWVSGHPAEATELGLDEPTLARLTEPTGGRLLRSLSELGEWGRAEAARRSLAGWALAVALAAAGLGVLVETAIRKGWWG